MIHRKYRAIFSIFAGLWFDFQGLSIIQHMEEHIVDFSLLEELSGGDPKYKYELLEIFLNTVDNGLNNLQTLTEEGIDYDAIYKQAHALKSSAGIVKVRGMYEGLQKIEAMGRDIAEARTTAGKDEITALARQIAATYSQARPMLIAEYEKNKSAS